MEPSALFPQLVSPLALVFGCGFILGMDRELSG
jgi:hypothetical protein